jgi:hypothetical protein
MRLWPMRWNTNARTVERQCGHGRWHPDPDDLAYKRSIDNPMATLMRTMLLREAIASVSLSHPESCECDTCRAANGDELAEAKVLAALGQPPGAHDCDGCCRS